MLEILLFISVIFNASLLYFSTRLARRLFAVGTNLEALYGIIFSFRRHVEQVHESEVFYGDQTLQALILHSNQILDELDNYEDLMQIVELDEEKGDEEGEEEEE